MDAADEFNNLPGGQSTKSQTLGVSVTVGITLRVMEGDMAADRPG